MTLFTTNPWNGTSQTSASPVKAGLKREDLELIVETIKQIKAPTDWLLMSPNGDVWIAPPRDIMRALCQRVPFEDLIWKGEPK